MDQLLVALDVDNAIEAIEMAARLRGLCLLSAHRLPSSN